MSRSNVRRLVKGLPIGIVAYLCGSADLEDCVAYLDSWLEWIDAQPVWMCWASWQDCHGWFEAHLKAVSAAAGFHVD